MNPPVKPQVLKFPPDHGAYHVIIKRVVDGDTVDVYLLLEERVRLFGIQAHELKSPGGPEALAALQTILPLGTMRVVELCGREKFGRLLGDFRIEDTTASDSLKSRGHAVAWSGVGPRPP